MTRRLLALAVVAAALMPAVAQAGPIYFDMPDETVDVAGQCSVHVAVRDMVVHMPPPTGPSIYFYGWQGVESDCP